ncbi:hypothetical protein FACS1894170_13540 [Planctomycetales bacterium]|nr:hypothetical protein FACS1894170_13540 [Planctomycetales bacterium]
MTNVIPYILLVLTALFSSLGQLCFKTAARKGNTMPQTLFSFQFWTGGMCLILSLVLTYAAAKYVDYQILYAMTALNYGFIFLLTYFFLGETLDWRKIIGLVFIVIGLMVMIFGAA